MKKIILMVAGLVLAAMPLRAGEPGEHTAYVGSAQFEKMKKLAGRWEGTGEMPKPGTSIVVEYKVVSGGSVVMETISPGTPHEMVTMYHDLNGKLCMTHYCMLGNQPKMELKAQTEKGFKFDLAKGNDFNPKKDSHMHGLDLTFQDDDHITQSWVMYEAGKAKMHAVFNLARVK